MYPNSGKKFPTWVHVARHVDGSLRLTDQVGPQEESVYQSTSLVQADLHLQQLSSSRGGLRTISHPSVNRRGKPIACPIEGKVG
jgi:hypothetical protein